MKRLAVALILAASAAISFGQAVGGGGGAGSGGSVTWPASGYAVLSNGTNTPTGLAPVNGDCILGAAGAWTAGACGSGTVTSIGVTTANGISGTSSGGATPSLTLALGAINPSSTGATTPGPGAFTTLTGKQIGPIYYADQFSGADAGAKINACRAALDAIPGGTCDARGLASLTPATITPIVWVNDALVAADSTETLILPDYAFWNFSSTTTTQCGIEQGTNTAITGNIPGGAYAGTVLGAASSSTSMDSLYCTEPNPTGSGSYIRAEGFLALNSAAGTFANGLIHVQKLWDESTFKRMLAFNNYGDAWHIDYACCGDNFDQIQGYGSGSTSTSGNTAGYPLVIKGGNAFSITNSTFNGPGPGKNNIYIQGGGANLSPQQTPYDITFFNTYEEKYTNDYSTPMNYIGANSINTSFYGGYILTGCTGNSCTQYAFQNASTYGVSIQNWNLDTQTTNGVNDTANSFTCPSNGFTINYQSGYLSGAQTCNRAVLPLGKLSLTAQAASLSATNIYAVPATCQTTGSTTGCHYQVCLEATLTQVATSSSTFPYLNLVYVSATDGATKYAGVGEAGGSSGNATYESSTGCQVIYAKVSTEIQLATSSYASTGATPMQYSVAATVYQQ